ncbi:hypothetical protein Q1695_002830 [Nippostrongylus brasiliensis]|nr:hypothetical protein Q1695_002830 [Nippostrongylus brasiliensis]
MKPKSKKRKKHSGSEKGVVLVKNTKAYKDKQEKKKSKKKAKSKKHKSSKHHKRKHGTKHKKHKKTKGHHGKHAPHGQLPAGDASPRRQASPKKSKHRKEDGSEGQKQSPKYDDERRMRNDEGDYGERKHKDKKKGDKHHKTGGLPDEKKQKKEQDDFFLPEPKPGKPEVEKKDQEVATAEPIFGDGVQKKAAAADKEVAVQPTQRTPLKPQSEKRRSAEDASAPPPDAKMKERDRAVHKMALPPPLAREPDQMKTAREFAESPAKKKGVEVRTAKSISPKQAVEPAKQPEQALPPIAVSAKTAPADETPQPAPPPAAASLPPSSDDAQRKAAPAPAAPQAQAAPAPAPTGLEPTKESGQIYGVQPERPQPCIPLQQPPAQPQPQAAPQSYYSPMRKTGPTPPKETPPTGLRTASDFQPQPQPGGAFAPPPDGLQVNIDEILRLGGIMERRHMSPTKKISFEWIALNRHLVHQQPEVFSSHLVIAVGDVRIEKSLACDALNVLMYRHTITPDEYLRLCQHLERVDPITISILAQLLRCTSDQQPPHIISVAVLNTSSIERQSSKTLLTSQYLQTKNLFYWNRRPFTYF